MRVVLAGAGALAVVALAAVLSFAGIAQAGKPIKFPTPGEDFDVPAGAVCEFALENSYPGPNKGFAIVHTKRDGSMWFWGGGNNVTRITNTDTGAYVDLNTTGPGKIFDNPDGTTTIDGTGHWLVGYGVGDSPSQRLLLYSGHIVLRVELDGSLRLVSYSGTQPRDICAELTP